MDFLQQLQIFTKGDVQQAKWMVGIAFFILLPIAFVLIKNNLPLQKGMAIPLCILFFIHIGYGSYVFYAKPKHLSQIEQQFQSNPQKILAAELKKAETDDKSYTMLKYVWGICMIAFMALFFVLSKDYYRGLSLGLAGLFFAFLIIDSLFHQRLATYREALQTLLD